EPALAPRGAGGLDQADVLVVADRRWGEAAPLGDLSDGELVRCIHDPQNYLDLKLTSTCKFGSDAVRKEPNMPTAAIITGASRGLGRALAIALADEGWDLLLDARTETDLDAVVSRLKTVTNVWAVPGDVADPQHRRDLAEAAAEVAPIGLLVNNASTLGPSPLPRLEDADVADFAEVLSVNVVSPLAIFQAILPHLSLDAIVMNITSDAAVEPYEGWGLYGASKAALDHLSAVMAVEHPELRVYALDPGDMRTDMHQRAFPGEDISDRPLPEEVVPKILEVIRRRPPSGRIIAPQLKAVS